MPAEAGTPKSGLGFRFLRFRLGCRRGCGGGAGGVEASRHSAALSRGGVLVDRALGSDSIQSRRQFAQLRLGLLRIGQRGHESLELIFDPLFARAIASAVFEVLSDALLGG